MTWNEERLVEQVRVLAAALENTVLHQGKPMTEADQVGRMRLVDESRAMADEIEGPGD